MIRRPPRSTLDRPPAASDVNKRQVHMEALKRDPKDQQGPSRSGTSEPAPCDPEQQPWHGHQQHIAHVRPDEGEEPGPGGFAYTEQPPGSGQVPHEKGQHHVGHEVPWPFTFRASGIAFLRPEQRDPRHEDQRLSLIHISEPTRPY